MIVNQTNRCCGTGNYIISVFQQEVTGAYLSSPNSMTKLGQKSSGPRSTNIFAMYYVPLLAFLAVHKAIATLQFHALAVLTSQNCFVGQLMIKISIKYLMIKTVSSYEYVNLKFC